MNQAAIKAMNLKDPVGKNIKIGGGSLQIIGVVKDFHFESLHEAVKPSFILLAGGTSPWYKMIIRIKGGDPKATLDQIQHLYESYNPGFPFTYNFLDEAYQKQYETEARECLFCQNISQYTDIVPRAFRSGCIYGAKAPKEIGIRKVVGASVNGIALMLTKDFLKLVFIAILVAFPLSWWMMTQWLNGFAYRISISPSVFLIAGSAIILITVLTVSFQAIKAALANPVKSLKSE